MTVYLGSTFATYQYYTKNATKTYDMEAKSPVVSRETAYFQANIGKVKSVDDFVNDYKLLNYAMKAFGLEDMAYAKAYMKKVLNSDLTDKTSFANKLNDDKFSAFAKAFGGLSKGTAIDADTVSSTVTKYVNQSMETDIGTEDQGVQLALYFKRMASTVTTTYGLLANAALWKVMKTTYGFPDEMANADIEKQKKAVDAKFNIADLQDPAKVDKLLKRFTATWDATENLATDPILQLFTSSSSYNTSSSTGSSLLDLKYGG